MHDMQAYVNKCINMHNAKHDKIRGSNEIMNDAINEWRYAGEGNIGEDEYINKWINVCVCECMSGM